MSDSKPQEISLDLLDTANGGQGVSGGAGQRAAHTWPRDGAMFEGHDAFNAGGQSHGVRPGAGHAPAGPGSGLPDGAVFEGNDAFNAGGLGHAGHAARPADAAVRDGEGSESGDPPFRP